MNGHTTTRKLEREREREAYSATNNMLKFSGIARNLVLDQGLEA